MKRGKASNIDDSICPVCNSKIEFYWEPAFKGVRGRCVKCNTNWPES